MPTHTKKISQFTEFFHRLPLFATTPKLQTQLAIIEAYQFLPQLEAAKLDVIPQQKPQENKYLEYIPITWTSCALLAKTAISPCILKEIMWISMLNCQADEYMETIAEDCKAATLKGIIEGTITRHLAHSQCTSTGTDPTVVNRSDRPTKRLRIESPEPHSKEAIEAVLVRFVEAILDHASVRQRAPPRDQGLLASYQSFFVLMLDRMRTIAVLQFKAGVGHKSFKTQGEAISTG